MTAVARLEELGYRLSPPPATFGGYVRTVRTGNLVFTAGHGPFDANGQTAMRGRVGGDLTLEDGREAARLCAVACLSSVAAEIGDLERVARIVKVLAFVACADGFDDTSEVVNGASDLLLAVFGDRGVHARHAVGAAVLPKGIPVEIELIVEVSDD